MHRGECCDNSAIQEVTACLLIVSWRENKTSRGRNSSKTGSQLSFMRREVLGLDFLFVSSKSVCASTVIKHALNVTFGLGEGTSFHQMPNPNLRLTADELANLFGKSVNRVPRFVVTRNPFTRLLSGYNAKYRKDSDKSKEQVRPFPGTIPNFTFAMLIKSMHEEWRAKGDAYLATLNPHFRPVHMSHCGFSHGLTYDFLLPLEKLQTWADDFSKYTNLSAKSLKILKRTDPEGFDHHNYYTDSMLYDAYSEEMKKMTLEMFREDFKQLGYSPILRRTLT